jgi:hypothetical protein
MLDPEASSDIIIKVQGLGLEFDTNVKELNHWSLHMWAYTIKQHNMFKTKIRHQSLQYAHHLRVFWPRY